jgi:Fe2+ or Zn2+ uptake regulation protein
MNPTSLADKLIKQHIRPSYQRIKILEYLLDNRIHPTADQIFNAVHAHIPTLSKSTVYNTLNVFMEANLVRAVIIDGNEVRYDINGEEHGHFQCESCGRIYDSYMNIDALNADDLNDFAIKDKNVYFKGICPQCRQNRN